MHISKLILITTLAVPCMAQHSVAPNYVSASTVSWDSGAFAYDGAGSITAIGEDAYDYDAVGRLTGATAKTRDNLENLQRFTYDQHGNLRSVSTTNRYGTATVGLAVDSTTNQLTAAGCAETGGCLGAGSQYDQAGDLVMSPAGAGSATYAWDPLGALTELSEPFKHERYAYDANGERVLTVDLNAASQSYTIRGSDAGVAREFSRDASGAWQWRQDYVRAGTKLVAAFSVSGSTPNRHYHTDHLNTTRLVTDAAGYEVARYTYWPFGAEADGSDGGSTDRLRFTGHERDYGYGPAWDLDYMHARYYRPMWGRFLSVDKGACSPQSPQCLNRYAYVRNNPILRIDPDGWAGAVITKPTLTTVLSDPQAARERYTIDYTTASFTMPDFETKLNVSGKASVRQDHVSGQTIVQASLKLGDGFQFTLSADSDRTVQDGDNLDNGSGAYGKVSLKTPWKTWTDQWGKKESDDELTGAGTTTIAIVGNEKDGAVGVSVGAQGLFVTISRTWAIKLKSLNQDLLEDEKRAPAPRKINPEELHNHGSIQ